MMPELATITDLGEYRRRHPSQDEADVDLSLLRRVGERLLEEAEQRRHDDGGLDDAS